MTDSAYTYQIINKINLMNILFFIISIIAISFLVKGIRIFSFWISNKFPSKRMIFLAWVPIVNFFIYFFGLFIFFYIIFKPNREFLIAFVASSSLAAGFAVKDVITSVVAGIILLFDKPFQVGDRITFQGHYGDVLSIGLRSVKLLTLDESVVTIPNNRFLNDSVSSNSAGDPGMMIAVNVHVPPDADLYKIKEILQEEAEKNQYIDPREKVIIVGKEIFNGTISFMMTVKCILKDVRCEKAFQTDFLLSVNKKFKMIGIKYSSSV